MATATQIPTPESLDPTVKRRMHQSDSPREKIAVHSSSASWRVVSKHSVNSASDSNTIHRHRSSVFFEGGLEGEDAIVDARLRRSSRPSLRVRFRSKVDIFEPEQTTEFVSEPDTPTPASVRETSPLVPAMSRIMLLVLVVALMIPTFGDSAFLKAGTTPLGAKAGPIEVQIQEHKKTLPSVGKRQTSDTDVCKRWSGQSAVVNGTMYYYGGRKAASADQTTNQWNNDFLALDLTKTWQISTPSLTGLPRPSGVPAVSLGYLWNSYDSLYLYGGQFSDSPAASPSPFAVWQYDIASSSWTELDNDETSGGENAEASGQAVQRAAEGAGITIPSLGRGYYFGGHLDGYTVQGWSQSIPRQYLTSLLEYTFPGYGNEAVNNGATAGSGGIFRNITKGGVQGSAGFPERADGTLVYIPGYGEQGVLLGLAGGNNATFTQLNIIDVYDIATSSWYRQATSGAPPKVRVNPCAVVAASADGTSTQMYMFGGQDLVQGDQTQYNDMWILSIPSFTWIQVDTSQQSTPPGRAGHMCAAWNSQMVVWGGYVGKDLSCDSPGIYVFNLSSLSWQNEYQAPPGSDTDPLNRQPAQGHDASAIEGSYGYAVPDKVQAVIGGNAVGSATITAPVQTATSGPMATGSPVTYTVTGADGSVSTQTHVPGSGDSGSSGTNDGSSSSSDNNSNSNAGAIAGGVLAGVLAIIALYLGWCVYVYRRQLAVYKNHVALAQRQHLTAGHGGGGGREFLATGPASMMGKSSKEKSLTSSDYGGNYNNINNNNSTRPSDERSSTRGAYASNNNNNNNINGAYRTTSNNNNHDVPSSLPMGAMTMTARSSTDDNDIVVMAQEPSFVGILLNPRRSLRVVNRD